MKRREQLEDLKKLSESELEAKLKGFERELLNLRFRKASNQLEKPSMLLNARKQLARARTLLNQKRKEAAA